MGGYACADVENNKSFIETSPDRFLRSTKIASGLVNFSSFIFFSTNVRDIPLNDKILHLLRKVFGIQKAIDLIIQVFCFIFQELSF